MTLPKVKKSRAKLQPIMTSLYISGEFRDELLRYLNNRPRLSRNSILVALLRKGLAQANREARQ
jgi:hypothetical protein